MGIKRLFNYYFLRKPLKEIEMNKILEKISNKKTLNDRERKFVELYNLTKAGANKDYVLISKNVAFKKIREFLLNDVKVMCNLKDRDGIIGQFIVDIDCDIESENCIITTKGGIKSYLHDRFLYNLIYISERNYYTIEEHDEYYEKIEIEK
jgi:hypothetical protein